MTNQMLHEQDNKTTTIQIQRLLVAMELSLKTWRLAVSVEGQMRKRIKTVEAGHYEVLAEVVQEVKERWKLPEGTETVFCYEAGREGFHPYRRLTGQGYTVWVIDSASIEVSRKQRRAKSDGIDGDKLLALMQRQARGELVFNCIIKRL
jgi:transposase